LKSKSKHFILGQIKDAKISYLTAKSLGFEASTKLWETCQDHHIRNPGILYFVLKNFVGRIGM
jgi:hypothetical protein